MSGEQGHREAVEALSAQDEKREAEDRRPVARAGDGVDEEADGDEEHGGEHVAERGRELVQSMAHVAGRAEDAHEERAEGEGVVELEGDE